jgi:hypothetical protein
MRADSPVFSDGEKRRQKCRPARPMVIRAGVGGMGVHFFKAIALEIAICFLGINPRLRNKSKKIKCFLLLFEICTLGYTSLLPHRLFVKFDPIFCHEFLESTRMVVTQICAEIHRVSRSIFFDFDFQSNYILYQRCERTPRYFLTEGNEGRNARVWGRGRACF